MQDADGGVWPKLTSEKFGSFVMPEKDDGGLPLHRRHRESAVQELLRDG